MSKFDMMMNPRDHQAGYTIDFLIEKFGTQIMLDINDYFLDLPVGNWKKTLSNGKVVIFVAAMKDFAASALNKDYDPSVLLPRSQD